MRNITTISTCLQKCLFTTCVAQPKQFNTLQNLNRATTFESLSEHVHSYLVKYRQNGDQNIGDFNILSIRGRVLENCGLKPSQYNVGD